MRARLLGVAGALALLASTSVAQNLQVEEFILDNGMKFLFVARPGAPQIVCGWTAKFGSVNERPGTTGVAHLFEHMMFKGTHTIGTTDVESELVVIEEMDEVRAAVRQEELVLIERQRRGRIQDAKDPANRSDRHRRLLQQFEELQDRARSFIVSEEIWNTYSKAGASGMNAGTSEDSTVYFVQVPANKLELWFWLESDRLLHPVFREFYAERDVVHEERRRSTDSTPTGKFREQFESMFWQASPYSWPVIGWASDLEGITRAEAMEYFSLYYAPNNLTACLVGDFDLDEAKSMAELYFGRLERGARSPEPVRTLEVPQLAEKRMIAYADTNPSVTIRYHSVPDGHVDEPALVILGGILNGRTGRFYRSLVEGQKVATSASGGQNGMRYEGYFSLRGSAGEGHTPEEVEQALYAEIEKLKTEPVGERELQKIKNQNLVGRFRGLRSNFGLMRELLIRDVWRQWETINTDPPLYEAVTPADIMRVVQDYFVRDRRTVAIYYRKENDPSRGAD
ncbi:insulinase family protein [Candidatus Sumerlaeota bacterium]|nr:insulinase family protein [Candidatus Sumerlaeota bacterium]